ncbi:hypothetical protein Mevan_1630 [Methanococcus vannielii SB]|uniref:Uncharacterized protein n=1 Tax=Methanococcus vannielii (strain ATCC 35089 / DSM 1224 / JCM 13029 / OCM 148 / SB) TaxID=406327 RepID=A6USQ0_METVS|nr:hypothetical protein [Methanococcus vannielii]ABR55522.1 hypothetical protein Mevan_1630 [Methanococcus vannielii SB]
MDLGTKPAAILGFLSIGCFLVVIFLSIWLYPELKFYELFLNGLTGYGTFVAAIMAAVVLYEMVDQNAMNEQLTEMKKQYAFSISPDIVPQTDNFYFLHAPNGDFKWFTKATASEIAYFFSIKNANINSNERNHISLQDYEKRISILHKEVTDTTAKYWPTPYLSFINVGRGPAFNFIVKYDLEHLKNQIESKFKNEEVTITDSKIKINNTEYNVANESPKILTPYYSEENILKHEFPNFINEIFKILIKNTSNQYDISLKLNIEYYDIYNKTPIKSPKSSFELKISPVLKNDNTSIYSVNFNTI